MVKVEREETRHSYPRDMRAKSQRWSVGLGDIRAENQGHSYLRDTRAEGQKEKGTVGTEF